MNDAGTAEVAREGETAAVSTVESGGDTGLPLAALATLGTGLFGLGAAVGSYGAFVSALIARGVAPDAAGFGMTIFLFGQFAAVLPADVLTRRYGPARVAAGGFVLGGVGAAVGGTLDLTTVYLSRSLVGLGSGVAFLASVKYAGLRTPKGSRSLAQGLLGAAFTLGLAGGLAVGPPLLARFGPGTVALGAALVTVAPVAVVPRLRAVPGGTVRRLGRYLAPLRSPSSLALGAANMASFGLLIVATTWYADVLATEPALPATAILVGFSLATVLGRFGGGWVARALNERAAVALTLVLLCALLGVVAAAVAFDAPVLLAAALVGTGAGFGLPFGPLFSLAFSNLGDDPGVTLVAMTATGNAGALAYPWLVGRLLTETDSYAGGFAAMALTVAVVVVFWAWTVGVRE